MVLGKKCVFRNCGRYSVQYPELKFLKFPEDRVLRRVWITNSGVEKGIDMSNAYICEFHFKKTMPADLNNATPIHYREKDPDQFSKGLISNFLAHSCKYCGTIFSSELTSTQHLFYCSSLREINNQNVIQAGKYIKKCVVTRCKYSPGEIFALPSEINLRKLWLQNVPVPMKFMPSINTFYVCEKHFYKSDIIRDSSGTRLKENAVPSNFSFPTVQDASVQPCCVPSCTSNHSSPNTKPIITFPFPTDFQYLAREWQNILLKHFLVFIPNGSICLNHFRSEDVVINGKLNFLKHGTLPAIFQKTFENKRVKLHFLSDYQSVKESDTKAESIIDITSDSEDGALKTDISGRKVLGVENVELFCCVPNCPETGMGTRGFHVFPLRGETFVEVIYAQPPTKAATSGIVMDLLDLWMSRACINEVTSSTVICTKHFTSADYVSTKNSYELDKYAFPTIELPGKFPPCMILPKEKDKVRSVFKPPTVENKAKADDIQPCSVPECFSHLSSEGLQGSRRTFSFPNDINKAKEWAEIFGHQDWLYNGLDWARQNIRICSAHFESCMFTDNYKLKEGALPFPCDPLSDKPVIQELHTPVSTSPTATTPTSIKPEDDTTQKKKLPIILSKNSKKDELNLQDAIYFPSRDLVAQGASEKKSNNLQASHFYVKCSVVSCNNYFDDSRGEYLGQSYFLFPTLPEYRNAWIKAMNKPYRWNPSKRSRICFRHFNSSDVRDGKLKRGAIPTLCLDKPSNVKEGSDESNITVVNPFEIKNKVKKGRKSIEKPREEMECFEEPDSDKKSKKEKPPKKPYVRNPNKKRNKRPVGRPSKKRKTLVDSCSSTQEVSEDDHHFEVVQENEESNDFSDDLPEEPEIKLEEASNCFIIKEEIQDFEPERLESDPQNNDVDIKIKNELEEVVELSDTEIQESILSKSLMCDQSPAILEVDDFMEFCYLLKSDFAKLNATDKFDFITSMKKKMSDLLNKNYP